MYYLVIWLLSKLTEETSESLAGYLNRLTLQEVEVKCRPVEERLPFETIEGLQATGGSLT